MTKILYVEDEPFLGKIVKESLESRGYEICMVSDGNKAISTFESCEPNLCILDVMLPGKDGFTIGHEIKMLKPFIPIIFLTAKDQTEDIVKGFESGGNDYIRKPFSMEELILRINNLLNLTQQNSTQHAVVHEVGNFTFDHSALELRSGDNLVKLSHREAELLKILIKGNKEVVARSSILKQIWGDDHFFNSRNLDVYIRKLRKLLASDPSVQIITLKSVGYRFIY